MTLPSEKNTNGFPGRLLLNLPRAGYHSDSLKYGIFVPGVGRIVCAAASNVQSSPSRYSVLRSKLFTESIPSALYINGAASSVPMKSTVSFVITLSEKSGGTRESMAMATNAVIAMTAAIRTLFIFAALSG